MAVLNGAVAAGSSYVEALCIRTVLCNGIPAGMKLPYLLRPEVGKPFDAAGPIPIRLQGRLANAFKVCGLSNGVTSAWECSRSGDADAYVRESCARGYANLFHMQFPKTSRRKILSERLSLPSKRPEVEDRHDT